MKTKIGQYDVEVSAGYLGRKSTPAFLMLMSAFCLAASKYYESACMAQMKELALRYTHDFEEAALR